MGRTRTATRAPAAVLLLGVASLVAATLPPPAGADEVVRPGPVVDAGGGAGTTPVGDWSATLDLYRAQARLHPLAVEGTWSAGAAAHSRYMVETDHVGDSESPSSPWYTSAGATAAQGSVLAAWIGPGSDPDLALPLWLASPFHGVAVLDPDLRRTGFGGYLDLEDPHVNAAAALDVARGLEPGSHARYPTSWPGTGSTVPRTELAGEVPDPLTACPGYRRPVGQPIYAFFADTPTEVATHLVRRFDGRPLDHCVITGRTYQHPDEVLGYVGRRELADRGAVVLLPRSPMVDGETYEYRVRGDGELVTGAFTIGPLAFAPFTDVPARHRFVEEITWLSSTGVVGGYRDGSYRPTAPVSRQALVAFLWRLAGEPLTTPGTTFPDVPADHPFAAPVAWAVASGIVEGYADGSFRPTEPVSRQAAVALLARSGLGAGAGGDHATRFADVPADHPFADEIAWGVQAGVVEGYADGTFRPTAPVSRQAVAAMLTRLAR